MDGVEITAGMYHVKITEEQTGASLIWTGIGHQWSNTGVSISYWIYAMLNSGKDSYYSFNHVGNFSKVEGHNSGKTRIVRCIKSLGSHVI